jgi:uncharacterized membrane protein HdeD (DUF308 family)
MAAGGPPPAPNVNGKRIMNSPIAERHYSPADLAEEIHEHKWYFWIGGALAVVAGACAILMPYVATLAAGLVIGAILAVNGLIQCVVSFKARRASRVAMSFVLGLLGLAAGVFLLVYPLGGVVALTLVLTAFFLAGGLLKLYFAWSVRPSKGGIWLAVAGLLSIGLGVLIWSGLPGTAFWVLGLLVGIDLIFFGITLLATVMEARGLAGHSGNTGDTGDAASQHA